MRTLKTLSNLAADRPVHIYGAGRGGRIVKREIDRAGRVRVTAFVDQEAKGDIDGLRVLSATDFIASADRQTRVVIASQYWPEISTLLIGAGFQDLHNAWPLIQSQLQGSPNARDRRRQAAKRAFLFPLAGGLLLLAALLSLI